MTIRIDYLGLISLALLVLKLTDTISITWMWVLAPIWVPFAFITAVFAGMAILATISFVLNMLGTKR